MENEEMNIRCQNMSQKLQKLEDRYTVPKSQKGTLDKKKEELFTRTRKQFELEKELKLCHERESVIITENEKMKSKFQNMSQKLQKSENRYTVENSQKETIDKKNEELVSLTKKQFELEEELKLRNKRQSEIIMAYKEMKIKFQNMSQKLQESEDRYKSSGNKRLSDIENENEGLSRELTMSLKTIDKLKQDYKILVKRHEKETSKNREALSEIQAQLNSKKLQVVNQQEASRTLDHEKHNLTSKMHSLENYNTELHDRIQKAEANIKQMQITRDENERLKKTLSAMRCRYNLEADRIGTEDIKNKLKIENDRLRNERNSARTDLRRMAKDNHELKSDIQVVNDECDHLTKKKTELVSVFKVEMEKNKDHTDKLEREIETLRARLDNVVDEVKELTMKNHFLQSENMELRSKLQDVRIQFNEWNTISSKISSIFDRNVTAGDLEKENQNLKETIQIMDADKMRLENEVSITLNKLSKSREDCDTRTKRYEKGELVNCMTDENQNGYTTETLENVSLSSESCGENVVKEKEHALCTVEHGMTQSQVGTNPASNIRHISHLPFYDSSRDGGRNDRRLSSDRNIYKITAGTVNIIKGSTVGLEKRMAINNTTNSNMPMEIEN